MSTRHEQLPSATIKSQRLRGQVLHGDKLGRTIGFPTANMIVPDERKPAYGIYASRVLLAPMAESF